ncbi:conserved hypothetical protein [Enterobacterales bacterium 8AC]|nr:conserved hypothetical protein [Enterobacterales bacterium 8AC]
MTKNIIFSLKKLNGNIARVISNGETAGFIVLPENEHQNQKAFAVTHNGKDIGYAHCHVCAIESVIRRFERIPLDTGISLLTKKDVCEISISVAPLH